MSHQAHLGEGLDLKALAMERVRVCQQLQGQPSQPAYSGRGAPGTSVSLPDQAAHGNVQGLTRHRGQTNFTKEGYCLHSPGGPGRGSLSHWQTQLLRGRVGGGGDNADCRGPGQGPAWKWGSGQTSELQPSSLWGLSAPLGAHHGDAERRPMGAHG